jgi:hypothetical protein
VAEEGSVVRYWKATYREHELTEWGGKKARKKEREKESDKIKEKLRIHCSKLRWEN